MKYKSIISILFLFGMFTTAEGQNLIKGATKLVKYKSGATKDSEMKLTDGSNLLIGFRTYFVEIKIIKGSVGQNILSIEENKDWEILQACEYDFDGDGKNEIVVAWGDGLSSMKVSVNKKVGSTYKEIGSFEGQSVCQLSKGKITMPFGSQGLFDQYTLKGGKFVRTN